jgi:hypothetical protein
MLAAEVARPLDASSGCSVSSMQLKRKRPAPIFAAWGVGS